MVTSPGLRHPSFRLVKAGEQIPLTRYAKDVPWRPRPFTGTAEVGAIVEEFDRGATIVLQGLHHSWAPLAVWCRELEAALGHPAQANAYLTPRRSQGLPVHHDTHDVFVLQVSGTKRWQVYEPVHELPLKHQRYAKEMGDPGEAVLDIEIGPGDTLYLPRGWLHQALTSDEDSLHLTVGVNVVTWLDAFRAALDRLEGDPAFRRGLPADGAGAEALLPRLAERLGAEEVAAAAREKLVGTRRPVLDGQLSQLRALDRLDGETVVERRPGILHDVAHGDGEVRLSWAGRTVSLPAAAAEAVEHAASAEEPFRVRDLPGLDDDGRLVLVRRLVREGFLRVRL